MNQGTLDDRYFEWLYSQIGSVRNGNPSRSYWHLAKCFYVTPFAWSIANDDNRGEDGKELRYEFLSEYSITQIDQAWMELDCSFLEMLIGLARRASFQSFGEPGDWFWLFVGNLGLREINDGVYSPKKEKEVKLKLEQLMYREYDKNGDGGLFPLSYTRYDQRRIEIWDQLSEYLLEGNYIDHGP